jgi:putative DNA primase/helicase
MIEIAEQAHNRWASILGMLDVSPKSLTGRHGPCPLCGGKDRFRFDNQNGRGTWICNNCGAGSGMDMALRMTGLSFRDCATKIRSLLGDATETKPRPAIDRNWAKRHCQDLWAAGMPLAGTEAETYLAGRGIVTPETQALRFHPDVQITGYSASSLGAIVARVVDVEGNGVAIHRTYLEGGRKVARKLLAANAKLPDSVMVRLVPHSGVLGIAEGIETALAVSRDFGIPCWSVINAGFMSKFIAPADVTELYVFGDNDLKFAGQAAATECARRNAVRPDSPTVHVRIPNRPGSDWADVSQQENNA